MVYTLYVVSVGKFFFIRSSLKSLHLFICFTILHSLVGIKIAAKSTWIIPVNMVELIGSNDIKDI